MAIHPDALALICEFEGYLRPLKDGTDRVKPYLCPANVPTIGFGSIFRRDGSRVAMSDPPITRAEAMDLMDLELIRKCEPAVSRLITVPLHPLMHGALISFVYNCGAGALSGSGLRRAVNERRWSDVPGEFAKWRMGGGRILPGLVRRRAAEAAMFMKGVAAQRTAPADDGGGWITTIMRAA